MLLTGWPARGILFLLLLFFYISQWGYSSFLSFLQVSFQHLSRLLLQLSCCFVTTTGAALKAAGFFPELLLSSLLPHSEKHGLYCLFFTLPFFFFLTKWAENHSFFPLDKADIRQVHLFSLQDQWQKKLHGHLKLTSHSSRELTAEEMTILQLFFKITEEINLDVCVLNTISELT